MVLGAPVAAAGADQTVTSRATANTVDGSGSSDPQHQPLTYLWTQVGGPPTVIADPSKAKTSVTVPTGPADVTLAVKATNSSGLSSSDTVVLHVRAPK